MHVSQDHTRYCIYHNNNKIGIKSNTNTISFKINNVNSVDLSFYYYSSSNSSSTSSGNNNNNNNKGSNRDSNYRA